MNSKSIYLSRFRPTSKGIKSPIRPQRSPIKLSHRISHSRPRKQSEAMSPPKPTIFQLSGRPQSTRKTRGSHGRRFSLDMPVFSNCSYRSKKGYVPENPRKPNQDSVLVLDDISGYSLYAVCDGHGQFGHEVSSFVTRRLPVILTQDLLMKKDPVKALESTILRVSSETRRLNVDTHLSGTTLVAVLLNKSCLFCANVGDSRAIVVKKDCSVVEISRDHKPDIPEEAARIKKAGGRVDAYRDEFGFRQGPPRVWLHGHNAPGLAMSRSIGDQVAARAGVISQPEIMRHDIAEDDLLLVIGSDGIFEFLTNEDVAKITRKWSSPSDITRHLTDTAHMKWVEEEDVVDDISVICVLLNNH